MTDNLRDRIAAALQGAADDGYSPEDWLFLADAVIRELGLDECDNHDCRCRHEYVTDRKADDA
jgi:hypothetical protein